MELRSPICDLFGIDYPIVLASMGDASGPELAAAVSNAGGLGVKIPEYQKRVLLTSSDRDTMVSRSATGKPARGVRSKWAELYERGDIAPLPMPLQGIVATPVMASAIANERADLFAGFAGQGIGLVRDITPAQQVFERILDEAATLLAGVTTLPNVVASGRVRT